MPGFDYKFLEKPKRRFQCPLCSKAMREPVQVSTCGHRFCDTCLQEFLRYVVCLCVHGRQTERHLCVGDTREHSPSSFGRATVNKGCVGVSSSPFYIGVLHQCYYDHDSTSGAAALRLGWTLFFCSCCCFSSTMIDFRF